MAETPTPPRKQTLHEIVDEWTKTIVFGLMWYFCIITFVFEAYKIPSQSMFPTLNGEETMWGDRVFALKALDQFRELRRGDVIVFNSVEPQKDNIQRRLVKRLVGFAGEQLSIVGGKLCVNGTPLADPPYFSTKEYAYPTTPRGYLDNKGQTYTVPPGHVFVLGDNTNHSNDGRYWGPVPVDAILGRALFVWWPLSRWSLLHARTPAPPNPQ